MIKLILLPDKLMEKFMPLNAGLAQNFTLPVEREVCVDLVASVN